MSRGNRRRRSAADLLNESRSILFAGSDDEDSPERPAAMEMDQLAALAQALQLAGRPNFKPPSFSGEENIDLFIKQFEAVAEANHWSPLERTLHLRGQLSGDAQSCGQGDDYEEIIEDLRDRYGLTKRKARDRLSAIQLRAGQDVHKQAAEINRLVSIAFPVLPDQERQVMALEYFSRAWEGKAVQEHLLAVRPTSMREAVRATEDFLAVHTAGPRPRALAVEKAEDEEGERIATCDELGLMAEALTTQTALLRQLLAQVGTSPLGQPTTQATPEVTPARQPTQPVKCFGCGGEHYYRGCPQKKQGNGQGPARK